MNGARTYAALTPPPCAHTDAPPNLLVLCALKNQPSPFLYELDVCAATCQSFSFMEAGISGFENTQNQPCSTFFGSGALSLSLYLQHEPCIQIRKLTTHDS